MTFDAHRLTSDPNAKPVDSILGIVADSAQDAVEQIRRIWPFSVFVIQPSEKKAA